MTEFAHPETLVDTEWAAAHLNDSTVIFAEVDVDNYSFEEGHLPGAIGWNWSTQLCDTHERNILSKEQFESLMKNAGIKVDSTVVLYGDNNNWFAAWALWQMKIYGHGDVRLMDGGRKKWLAEGRELTDEIANREKSEYQAKDANSGLRSMLPEVMSDVAEKKIFLVDVRSPAEYSGEILAPPGLPETCQRGGHIPLASSIPWGIVCQDDGTFKPFEELKDIYAKQGVTNEKPTVAYCRIGERSSHSWFVLKYLLGFDDVKNYDGSWTEWGNLVAAPIEK